MEIKYRIYSYRKGTYGWDVYSSDLNGENELHVYGYQGEEAARSHAESLNKLEPARYAAAVEAQKRAIESIRRERYTGTPADYYGCGRYCGD